MPPPHRHPQREINADNKSVWRPLPQYNAITQLDAAGEPLEGAVYTMDHVATEGTSELYGAVCSKVVRSAVGGIHGTIFVSRREVVAGSAVSCRVVRAQARPLRCAAVPYRPLPPLQPPDTRKRAHHHRTTYV